MKVNFTDSEICVLSSEPSFREVLRTAIDAGLISRYWAPVNGVVSIAELNRASYIKLSSIRKYLASLEVDAFVSSEPMFAMADWANLLSRNKSALLDQTAYHSHHAFSEVLLDRKWKGRKLPRGCILAAVLLEYNVEWVGGGAAVLVKPVQECTKCGQEFQRSYETDECLDCTLANLTTGLL
jgi:hypothetical protein